MKQTISTQNRLIGSLIGLACGDAVGTTLEFKLPGTFEPISDMVGGGPFNLKAALWCFATTDSFEMTILKAANLGEDADTTAAICGQIAGAYYGLTHE